MDSTTTSATKRHHQPPPPPPPIVAYETSPTTNTTFVHAHPSNFRAVVQHLTGSSSHGGAPPLHERREKAALTSMKKLEMINLNHNRHCGPCHPNAAGLCLGLVSPVSTLDGLLSPNTPTDNNYFMSEEEERAVIAEKGFYLHPIKIKKTVSPFNNYNADPPQLLPLFPLHSSSSQSHDHPDDHHY